MIFKFVAITLFALFAIVASEEAASQVIVLTADNFESEISKHPLLLVEFYAPWCGHCKKLTPEYDAASLKLHEFGIPIAKMDADEEKNKPFANRFGIKGFPTLKVFRNGKVSNDYDAGRTTDAIVSYMKKQALPAISELKNADEATKFSTSDKVIVIGFFDNAESADYTTFKSASELFRNKYIFGSVVGLSDVNSALGVTETPSVVLFKKFDEGKAVLSKDKISELAQWLKTAGTPLIDELGPENYNNYMEAKLPLAYLFVDPSVSGQKDEFIAKIRETAEATKGKINWVWIDSVKYGRHAERVGLSGKTFPALTIDIDGKHYAFDEKSTITAESVSEFSNNYLNGKLEPTIRSEEVPVSNDGPVKIVVAKNFQDIVMDTDKDVFLEFYAPWCGHCKQLAPTFEELGQRFSDIPSIVVAKIDATANDVDPKYGVRGFPTLEFFPATNKGAPADYEGDRSLEDMFKFIKDQATIKIDESRIKGISKDEL